MDNRSRTAKPKPRVDQKRAAATSPRDWTRLLVKAIAMAKKTKDRRLEGLLKAQETGTAAKYLKKLSIICEADLTREFPDPT